MKYQRPGYCEGSIMVARYLQKIDAHKYRAIYLSAFQQFTNWLYTTSGFYDSKIKGTYFDFDSTEILDSECFIKFLEIYENSLVYSSKLNLLAHQFTEPYLITNYIDQVLQPNDIDEFWVNYQTWYKVLENKKILIVSSFAPLIVEQYESYNIFNIDPNFPRLADIIPYRTPYTFFNRGPHVNYFETLHTMLEDIKKINFDIAIVSCGAYACPIVQEIHVNKLAISIGSRISHMFGICPQREPKKYWITEIPQAYIPEGHEKIENSKYWL